MSLIKRDGVRVGKRGLGGEGEGGGGVDMREEILGCHFFLKFSCIKPLI